MLTALKDQPRSSIAWLLGGLPLLVSSLQSISALFGNSTLFWLPVIGDLARVSAGLPVIKEAAIVFYGQTSIILFLFLLIAVAWVAQGVLMFSETGREQPYSKTGSAGAVVLSGLLYGFLFLGVYSPLLSKSIGLSQIIGFFLIPLLATGSLGLAYRTYSWKDQRRAEAIARIKSAERQAKSQRRSMEAELEDLPLDKVERISPDAVEEAIEIREDFFSECDSIIKNANDTLDNSNVLSVSTLEKRSHSLEQQAKALDASRTVSDLEERLRRALDSVVDNRFGNIRNEFNSRYGNRYKTSNLPDDLRSIDITGSDEKIIVSTAQKDSIADQLHNVILHHELPLVEAIELLDTVDSKIYNEILPHLNKFEDEFYETESRVQDNIDIAATKIEQVGGHTGTALDRIFISEIINEETSSAKDIETKLDKAREKLHECESLEAAIDQVNEAESMSEEYVESVEFIRSVLLPGIERNKEGIGSVPHPGSRDFSFFTEELIEKLQEPIRNDFGASIELDLAKSEIKIDYDVEAGNKDEIVREQPENTGPRDEVKYLIREFQSSAGDGDVPSEGTVGIKDLPTSVKNSNPVPEFVEFIESTDELEIVNYPDETGDGNTDSGGSLQNPGYISITSAEGEPINLITTDLIDKYRTWSKEV